MELKVIDGNGQVASSLNASDAVFAREYNEGLVHQLVTAYMANSRSASSKQKDRSEVAHSTHKPFAQKGTGRARAGMTSSPIWRSGGKAFPNTGLENYTHKVNRKMYRAGMSSILSKLVSDDKLIVVDELKVDAPKTKQFAQKMNDLGLKAQKVIFVAEDIDENLYLSSRNIANVLVVEPHQADPVSLVGCAKVVMTKSAVAKIEEMFA